MTLLSIRNLNLAIRGTKILRNVALDVRPGEIVAITGESGSGKSMTALAAMGLTPDGSALDGEILLDGEDVAQADERRLCSLRGRKISMVFQEPMTALNPVQTIGDQVSETILMHTRASRAEAAEQADIYLRRVGLDMPLSRFPHELSGGQRQRVVIAMAIALRPKLLIADEPTTALDVTTQAKILELLKGLVDEFGMGLLMITHDLAVVAEMADRICIIQNGEVVERGETKALLRGMQHPYTKALFAASRHVVDMPAASAGAPLLQVSDVVRRYPTRRKTLLGRRGSFEALKGVSFQIKEGERLGLVGESGCGKSTLTRAVLGLDPIQGGAITLHGTPVFSGRHPDLTVRRKMQVVFQDPFSSFNPRHRVERLITEPFYLLPRPPEGAERQRAIDRALTDVGLRPADAQKYIHEFSGGQRQRIAIARALINEPELIVFDEAVSALDVSVRAQVLDLLADLCRTRHLSYLFISHDLSVVRDVTTRVLVMQAGEIVEQGPTSAVFETPRHPYTQRLIAAAPRLPDM